MSGRVRGGGGSVRGEWRGVGGVVLRDKWDEMVGWVGE